MQVVNPTARTYRIVGVIARSQAAWRAREPSPFVYFADAQRPTLQFHLARTNGGADALLAAMRRELLAMESGLVFMGNSTMEQNWARA